MNGANFQQREIDLAVGLVNTWDVLDEEPEFLSGVGNLRKFLHEHCLEREARVATEGDLTRVRSLRRRVRSVFEADTEAEAVETLNDYCRLGAAAAAGEGRLALRLRAATRRDRRPARAQVAAALLVAIQTEGWERFGSATPFLPLRLPRPPRNRSRRYCQLCADRIAAAAYRERSKGRSA
jgi:hypothetical protein